MSERTASAISDVLGALMDDRDQLRAALQRIADLPSRWHPIAGVMYDGDPAKIACEALAYSAGEATATHEQADA